MSQQQNLNAIGFYIGKLIRDAELLSDINADDAELVNKYGSEIDIIRTSLLRAYDYFNIVIEDLERVINYSKQGEDNGYDAKDDLDHSWDDPTRPLTGFDGNKNYKDYKNL